MSTLLRMRLARHRVPLALVGIYYIAFPLSLAEPYPFATEPGWIILFVVVGLNVLFATWKWRSKWVRASSLAAVMTAAGLRAAALFGELGFHAPPAWQWALIGFLQFYSWPFLLPPRVEPADFLPAERCGLSS